MIVAPANLISVGARTALGFAAAASAAAARAGISGMREHPLLVTRTGKPVVGAFDWGLPLELCGEDRLLELARSALREACLPLHAADPKRLRVSLHLALPEFRPGFGSQEARRIVAGLAHTEDLPVRVFDLHHISQGHASGLAALESALLELHRGTSNACFVGGVDSYFDQVTIGWLDEERRIASPETRSGFVPGEGGGFLLLADTDVLVEFGLHPVAHVLTAAHAMETAPMSKRLGEGLTEALRAALDVTFPSSPLVDEVICDLNGEAHRNEEWGFGCLRLGDRFVDPTGYRCPADCWGDVGAASAPLFAMLACEAASRGYAAGPRTMIWASSNGGLRGAAILETVMA
jgi:3-oxoacyl-[acyl-carrier-protein] synthase-1